MSVYLFLWLRRVLLSGLKHSLSKPEAVSLYPCIPLHLFISRWLIALVTRLMARVFGSGYSREQLLYSQHWRLWQNVTCEECKLVGNMNMNSVMTDRERARERLKSLPNHFSSILFFVWFLIIFCMPSSFASAFRNNLLNSLVALLISKAGVTNSLNIFFWK